MNNGKGRSVKDRIVARLQSLYTRVIENKAIRKIDSVNDRVADAMLDSINQFYRWFFKPGGVFGFGHTYSKTFQTFILGSLVSTIILGICIFPESTSAIGTTHVLFISTCVALGSFFLNSYASGKAERKRITVEFVFDTREKREYQHAVAVLQQCSVWVTEKKITWEQYNGWSKAAKKPASDLNEHQKQEITYYRAISYLLNYYEFMSAGLCTDALDEELIHRMMRSYLVNLVSKTEDIIYELRRPKTEVNLSTGTSAENYDHGKALCHLVYMFNRWNEEDQDLVLGPNPEPYVHREPSISQVSYDITLAREFANSDEGAYEKYRNSEVNSRLESLSEDARADVTNEAMTRLDETGLKPDTLLAGHIYRAERLVVEEKLNLPDLQAWMLSHKKN